MHEREDPIDEDALRRHLPEDLPLISVAEAVLVASTPRSTVLRLRDEGGARYFFKRDHILAPCEATIVVRLALRWPKRIAPIVAADEAAGWTLTEDVGADRIDEAPTGRWETAVRHFAEVQRDPGLEPDAWRALGCRDLRGPRLLEAIDAMLADHAGGIDADLRERLHARRRRIAAACAELASDGVPATLVHQDLVPVNIVLHGEETVFIDWSDTVVGHPFFGFDRLLDACWSDRERKAAVIQAYLDAFAGVVPADRLRASFDRVLFLRVLYEGVRWHHELAEVDPACAHAERLRRDVAVGLGAMARSAANE